MLKLAIEELLKKAAIDAGVPAGLATLFHPEFFEHGDFSTNLPLVAGKILGRSPRELAEKLVSAMPESELIAKTEIAGPGFINIFLTKTILLDSLKEIVNLRTAFGLNTALFGQRLMYEFTDPNPFKVFHVGHLMSNTIGEALARLAEANGATVLRANYQGDVGLHVAKAIYGMLMARAEMPAEEASLTEKTAWLGECYARGAAAYEENERAKEEIAVLNKKIFEKSDADINKLYVVGRGWSLEHFEEIYKKLGTKFSYYFFESEVSERGVNVVREQTQKGVFEESEGAIIFDGEKYGLHKRVFITSAGLPAYEAKDVGLNLIKFEKEPMLAHSVIITGSEQNEYMRVLFKAIEQFAPNVTKKTKHIGHGLILGKDGKKSSSRKGGVESGEGLLSEVESAAREKIKNGKHDFSLETEAETAEKIAVAAIKYSILKQQIGKNIIFDREQALSFEGDSGPYLQYTYARTQSLLRKGKELDLTPSFEGGCDTFGQLERFLYRLPEITKRAADDYTPSYLTTFLVETAGYFNSYYAKTRIADPHDPHTSYRLALAAATGQVLKNGLAILGIPVLERM